MQWLWDKEQLEKLWHHRLFLGVYPVYKKYLPSRFDSFLEIGAGTGKYSCKFALEHPEAHFDLTDPSPSSQEVIDSYSIPNVHAINAWGSDIPSAYTYDVVFSDFVVQHIPDRKPVYDEMYRLLNKNGTVILSVVNYWNPHTLLKGKEYGYQHSFTKQEITKELEESGFTVQKVEGIYAAYGIFRHKKHFGMRLLSGIISRAGRMFPFINNYFGFGLVVVATK